MKNALERFKVAATGRWAVSIRIYVLTVPFALMINVERENILNPGYLSHAIAICITGELASYLYLFIAQATLLKHRRIKLQSLSKCAFVWFSTGTIKGIFFILYATRAYGYDADFLARIIMPTVFSGFSGALLAFYFGTIDRRRIENRALNSLDELLAVDQGLSFANDAKARSAAIGVLRETLLPQLEKLEDSLAAIAGSNSETNVMFKSLAHQSQELGSAIDTEANAIARSRAEDPKKNRAADEVSFFSAVLPKVISVRVTLTVVILGMFTSQMTRNGPTGVASGLVGAAVLGVVLFILRRLSKKLTGVALRNFVLASFPIVFFTQFIYVSNLSRIGFNLENPYMPWYSAMKTIYGFYIASIIASLIVDTTTHFENSLTENEKLRLEIAKLDREQEALARHLFTTRFGTIQGKISGVTMALQLASNHPSSQSNVMKTQDLVAGAIILLRDATLEIEALNKDYIGA